MNRSSITMTPMEAKAYISSFRVSELQMFLSYVAMNKLGRKEELVARACSVIDSRNFNDRIKAKIRELYEIAKNANIQAGQIPAGGMGVAPNGMMQARTNVPGMMPLGGVPTRMNHTLVAAALQANQARQERQGNPPQAIVPVRPQTVEMTELPFYTVLDQVLSPIILNPGNINVKVQESRIQFTLSPDQINQITHVRDTRPGVALDYPVQLQLRFCVCSMPPPQPDAFPYSFNVKINSKPAALPPAIPSNRQGVEAKRPPRPVNITPHVKFSPVVTNLVDVTWSYDITKHYAVALYLVKKLLPDQLLSQVKSRQPISKDLVKTRIREILGEDSEGLAAETLRISLRCPLGKMRMAMPCRAMPSCNSHLQCFDLAMFLHMNEKKATWVCPVCDKHADFKELVIDDYFQEVLGSDLTKNCDEVQLNIDGTYSPVVVDDEGKKEVKQVKAEVKGSATPSDSPGKKSSENKENRAGSPDLVTLSDEDEDASAAPAPAAAAAAPAAAPAPPAPEGIPLPGAAPPLPPSPSAAAAPPPLPPPPVDMEPEVFTIDDD